MSHDIPPFVRSWLDQAFAEAPDPDHVNRAVATAIRQTPQQRGRLPRLGRGRSQTMFGLIKLAAGTTFLALSGVLVTSVLTTRGPSDTPSVGAQAGPAATQAAWVTGTFGGNATPVGSPEITVEDGVTRSYPYHWEDMGPLEMSDPRLNGMISVIYNQDAYAVADDATILVISGTYRIENDEGSWEGTNIALNRGSGIATVSDTGVLVGRGAYEGLTAYLVFDFQQRPVSVVGAIFPGELPPIATFE
jgi:hypothetical protein